MGMLGKLWEVVSSKKDNKYLRNIVMPWWFGQKWVKANDQKSLLEAYKSWVYICASRNAKAFADAPLHLYAAKRDRGAKLLVPTKEVPRFKQKKLFAKYGELDAVRKGVELEEIIEHPFLDLIRQVNMFMNRTDLLVMTDLYQELTGEAYWYLYKGALGVPKEIWVIPPHKMFIVPHPEKYIEYYIYRNGATEIAFPPEEIIHFKWPNPNDPYHGQSPLQAVAATYNINYNMNEFENSMFSNNARPEGFYYTENEIDDASFQRLKQEILDIQSGIFNQGGTGLLDRGIKYEKMNWSPRDLAFLQGRKWTKEEIYEAFDTPMGLFNDTANRANAEAAQFVYAKYGISPRHRFFEEKLNERIIPMYDDKLFVAFEDIVPEDREFALKEDTELCKIGARTLDEIRSDRGLPVYPDELGAAPWVQGTFHRLGENPQPTIPQIPENLEDEDTDEEEQVAEAVTAITERILTGLKS